MKPSPVLLSLATLGLFSAAGQVVYLNPSPSLLVTSGGAGPNMFGSRYRVSGSDWDIAVSSGSAPGVLVGNSVTANLGSASDLNGEVGTFTLLHRAGTAASGGGFSWTLQFGATPPTSTTVLWGDSSFFSGTPPVGVSAASPELAWQSSSTGPIASVEANGVGRSINVLTLSAQATSDAGSSATLSNVAFSWNDTGSLTTVGNYNNANVVSPASAVTQSLYFSPPGGSGSLLDYDWTLAGNVTLNRVGGTHNNVMVNFTGFQQAFTVVPEPEEYMAALAGVSLVGAWYFRRRRSPHE